MSMICFFSCQSIQNLGLALATIISGIILDKYDYYWLEIFFISSLAGMKQLKLCTMSKKLMSMPSLLCKKFCGALEI